MTPAEQDPRYALERDIRPTIDMPRDGLPLPVMIGILAAVALGLFVFLDAHRRALHPADGVMVGRMATLQSPPPLTVPAARLSVTPAPMIIHDQPARPMTAMAQPMPFYRPPVPSSPPALVGEEPMQAPRPAMSRGGHDPALVIDMTTGGGATVGGGGPGGEGPASSSAALAADDTVRATLIRNRAAVMPQGAIIAAVLETPLNSDRPGLARAIVAQDARGFDGARVLIPRGSRLIGEFKADTAQGNRRVLVTWTRLIRPDGVASRIGSPATDARGGAGIAGSVTTHFTERFASAVLQSALTIGVNVATASVSSGTNTVYLGLPGQATMMGQQLMPNTNRPATVKVREGAEIAVLVARDLDFSGTPAVR